MAADHLTTTDSATDAGDDPGAWHVMLHPNPQLIELMLIRESRGDFAPPGSAPPEPFRFFVPYQFMRVARKRADGTQQRAAGRDVALDADADHLRTDFRWFVFIAASEARVRQLVGADWNRNGRLHLYYYRDTNRQPVTISADEVRRLRDTFQQRQLKYFFGQPLGDMAVGDEVTLRLQPWEGTKGRIEKIAYRRGRLVMTVAVNILCRTKSIAFHDLREGDVVFDDADKGRLLSGNLVSNFQEELLAVMGRRHADRAAKDLSRLNRLLGFHNVDIADDDDRRRFQSVMLVSATLVGDAVLASRLAAALMPTLADPRRATTATDAYVMIALFVYTRNPELRNAAKTYRQTHADSPDVLRRLLRRVRHIRAVRPASPGSA